MSKKTCEVSGGTPSCADWCDSNFIQQHCPEYAQRIDRDRAGLDLLVGR